MNPSHIVRAIALLCMIVVAAPTASRADVFSDVPEASNYSLIYTLAVPANQGSYNTNSIPYSVDNGGSFPAGTFDRVAYYLELSGSNTAGRANGFVYISFDRPAVFLNSLDIGVPSNGPNGSGISTNTMVANMNVFSNVAGVVTGLGLAGGKLEFSPSNYSPGPDGVFDYNDDNFTTASGHGSMQIHNVSAMQTLFGYSDWGGNTPGSPSEIGIGNEPTAGQAGGFSDWTFSDSGTAYTVRNMQILVRPIPEPGTTALLVLGAAGAGIWRLRARRS